MLENFNNLLDKYIYKISLLSISDKSDVYIDLSRKENILNMREEVVKEIFVQRTSSSNYVREIVTGMLIPVRRELVSINRVYFRELGQWCNFDELHWAYNRANSPTYVKIIRNKNDGFIYLDYRYHCSMLSYFTVKGEELSNYLKEHIDKDKWKSELEKIFSEGEKRYQMLLDKNEISNNRKANSKLVKKLRK